MDELVDGKAYWDFAEREKPHPVTWKHIEGNIQEELVKRVNKKMKGNNVEITWELMRWRLLPRLRQKSSTCTTDICSLRHSLAKIFGLVKKTLSKAQACLSQTRPRKTYLSYNHILLDTRDFRSIPLRTLSGGINVS